MRYRNPDYNALFPSWLRDCAVDALPPNYIKQKIRWAKEELQREDRIVWYLRWLKLAIADLCGDDEYEKAVKQYNKKTKGARIDADQVLVDLVGTRGSLYNIRFDGDVIETLLSHYLDLPFPDVQDLNYGWMLPNELLDTLDDLEEEGHRVTEGRLVPGYVPERDGFSVLQDFGDGFVWFNTHNYKVKATLRADTGHCSTCDDKSEEAWVLWEAKPGGWWRPVLQFCAKNGYLSERKGHGNEKPAAKYHKYIIPLIFSDAVQGFVPAAHLAENDFSVFDLPKEYQERAHNEKPALFTAEEYLDYFGEDEGFLQRVLAAPRVNLKAYIKLRGYDEVVAQIVQDVFSLSVTKADDGYRVVVATVEDMGVKTWLQGHVTIPAPYSMLLGTDGVARYIDKLLLSDDVLKKLAAQIPDDYYHAKLAATRSVGKGYGILRAAWQQGMEHPIAANVTIALQKAFCGMQTHLNLYWDNLDRWSYVAIPMRLDCVVLSAYIENDLSFVYVPEQAKDPSAFDTDVFRVCGPEGAADIQYTARLEDFLSVYFEDASTLPSTESVSEYQAEDDGAWQKAFNTFVAADPLQAAHLDEEVFWGVLTQSGKDIEAAIDEDRQFGGDYWEDDVDDDGRDDW
jgi:hypothetical protein